MKINKLQVGLALLAVLMLLTIAHTTLVLGGLQDEELLSLFRMDYEMSLLTWFSQVVLLFMPALLALYIGRGKRLAKAKYAVNWFIIGGLLVFLSIDDGAMIHEKFSLVAQLIGLQAVLDSISPEWFAWSWWVIYAAVFLVLAVGFAGWFWDLPRRTKLFFAAALIIIALGQVGLEALTGFLNANGNYDVLMRGFEKLVGRAGLVVLVVALLDYIQHLPTTERPIIKLDIS